MKKILFAAISLCVAAAAAATPLTAYAAGASSEPNYPEIFDDPLAFENLTDFAIAGDDLIVFADGSTLVHWSKEIKTVYNLASPVTNLDYDTVSGNFYYSLDGGVTSYILPDNPDSTPVKGTHAYDAPYEFLERDIFAGYHYYYQKQNGEDVLCVLDETELSQNNTTRLYGFFNAKVYGNQLYAITDNYLYTITGASQNKLTLYYSNFDKLTTISVGSVPEKLHTYDIFGENPKYVYITKGAWVTEFDINLLAPLDSDGKALSAPKYFPISEPKAKTYFNVSGPALLLCEAGNAKIVAQGKQVLIMNTSSATPLAPVDKVTVDQGTTAPVNVIGEYAHSLPFMSNATRTFALHPNEIVTVLYKVSGETLAHDFYIIENAKGERGYIVDKFLGDLNVPVPDESGANVTPDRNPNTDDSVRTVVLVLVVILLILITAGYLTWLSTSSKKKKGAINKDGEIDINGADENEE